MSMGERTTIKHSSVNFSAAMLYPVITIHPENTSDLDKYTQGPGKTSYLNSYPHRRATFKMACNTGNTAGYSTTVKTQ